MSFFEELKRRNVVRVGIAYVIAAWLLLQLTEVLIELLDLPDVAGRFVILFLIVGFIPALIFAWAFEMTPDGIKREKDIDRSQSITNKTGRKLDFTIIAVLVLALGYFVFDKFYAQTFEPPVTTVETADQNDTPAEVGVAEIDPSIAVLPFADLSPQQDQEYFSDGISEELLNLLVRVDGLKVASRTSSFTYKGSKLSLADIASELKVDHVLEGSVRKADNRVRITAQLIDAKTDRGGYLRHPG
jgi:TolB-like protein